jgi:hypothetical protein
MAFTPKPTKPEMERWKPDPDLPKVKYRVEERLNLTSLVQDITEKLPVNRFRDRVEFDDVVIRILEQVWPKWEDYFSPLVRNPFRKIVLRTVFESAGIEMNGISPKNKGYS